MRTAPFTLLRENLSALLRRPDKTNMDMVTVLAGHALRLSLGLLSSALLARGLGPTGLSAFAVVSAVIMIASTIGDFGLSQSAVRFIAADVEDRPEQAIELSRTYVLLKLLGTLLVVGFGFLLAGSISTWLQLPEASGDLFLRLGALGVGATALSGMVSTLLQSLRRFTLLIGTQSLNITLTLLLMAILFASGRLTVANALLIGIVTALAAALLGAWGTPAKWRDALLPVRHWSTTQARRLWGFGRWLWLATILSILLAQLDLLLVNRLTTPVQAGYYALALNLALKADVLNQTVHVVLLPQVSALTGRAQMAIYTRRSLLRGATFSLLLLPALFLAQPFIIFIYGEAFAPSVPLFLGLLLVVVLDLLVQPLLLLAYPLNMPRAIAVSHMVSVAILLLAGNVFIPVWGGQGAIAAKLLAKAVGAICLGSLLARRIRSF